MPVKDRRAYLIGLSLSGALAVFAGITNGFIKSPLPYFTGWWILLPVVAGLAWIASCGWMIRKYRWWGAVTLVGAAPALLFPIGYVVLVYACSVNGECL